MVIVAGPPGSGKTTRFPVAEFEVDSFNADNRAAQLNDGSFRGISKEIRSHVNVEFQKWILDHISAQKSFALETAPRSQVTFEQTHLAREHGFWSSMYYVTPGSFEECIKRIKARSYRGGHSASESIVRDIYQKSMHNLVTALDFGEGGINRVEIYDNSANLADEKNMRRIMSMRQGRVTSLASDVPGWLDHLLKATKFEIAAIRAFLQLRASRRTHDLGR
jgi:predicted ABC-type ATPase